MHLCEQAQKAICGVIRKIRHFKIPVNCQFDLFDKVVSPILMYGCEIGDFENLDIERVHLKFLKTVLNLRSTTPNMIYGETGCYPLYIIVFTRIITYGGKMLISHENKSVQVFTKYIQCTDI